MAYTRVWSDTVSGGVLANTIDTELSNVRLDIKERLLEIFTAIPATTAPLVFKDIVIGKVVGKIMLIPGIAFAVEGAEGHNVNDTDGYSQFTSVASPARAPLLLPVGITITKIRWVVNLGDTTSTTFKLMSKVFATGSSVVPANTLTKATTGQEIISSGVLAPGLVVDSTKMWWLEADRLGGSTFDIHGVEITYDTPDARNTI